MPDTKQISCYCKGDPCSRSQVNTERFQKSLRSYLLQIAYNQPKEFKLFP